MRMQCTFTSGPLARFNFWVKFIVIGALIHCVYLSILVLTPLNVVRLESKCVCSATGGLCRHTDTVCDTPRFLSPPVIVGSANNVTLDVHINMTISEFLSTYTEFCERAFRPPSAGQPLCACVPRGLVGSLELRFEASSQSQLELSQPMLRLGGTWKPADCTARQRVVIIIPYRDREAHLLALLNHLHPILQRQQLDYRIVVVEQVYPDIFNKATMMNIGFTEANKLGDFDCYIFHDVDVLAEDDRNFYTCAHHPRHVGAYLRKFNYSMKYPFIFGAATAFTREQFETVNGFSNEFYGWGGEDDDMSRRVEAHRFTKVRYPKSVARYQMIKHHRDEYNPYNRHARRGARRRSRFYRLNGLNSLNYTLCEVAYNPLYTHILAEIPAPVSRRFLPENLPNWKARVKGFTRAKDNVTVTVMTT